MEGALMARVNERAEIIEAFVNAEIASVIQLIREYQVSPRLFSFMYDNKQVTMKLGQDLLNITAAKMLVLPGSLTSIDRASMKRKAQELIQLAQVFQQVANVQEIYKEALRSMGYTNVERFIMNGGPMPTNANGQTPEQAMLSNGPQAGETPDPTQDQNGGI
jgi:hypothetical protein